MTGKDNFVIARYNMGFNNGSFKKNQSYKYRQEQNIFYITTEENKEQDFYFPEFQALFSIKKLKEGAAGQ